MDKEMADRMETFMEDEEVFYLCSICDGFLNLMGTLGTKDWYRCQDCGMEQTIKR